MTVLSTSEVLLTVFYGCVMLAMGFAVGRLTARRKKAHAPPATLREMAKLSFPYLPPDEAWTRWKKLIGGAP